MRRAQRHDCGRVGFAGPARRFAPVVALLACAAAACGGSSGGSPPGVAVGGAVTFDRVPATIDAGLDYANTVASPARGVSVQLVSEDTVIGEAVTDSAGRYSLAAPRNRSLFVRVRAEMRRGGGGDGAGSWHARVVDNTAGNALYTLDSPVFDTGTDDVTRDLHAQSGWDGAGFGGTRAAAPFAILDVVHDAIAFVQASDATLDFPLLQIHWSPLNAPSLGENGPDAPNGDIGTSFYAPGAGIFLLGAEDEDTDEYDRYVIAHEWAHYFEHAFSRNDAFGGPHALGDQLDPRVAFSEGWANAFSAMLIGDSRYRDAVGPQQGVTFGFDVSGQPPFRPGWFSEQSVHEILYQLFAAPAGDQGQGQGQGPGPAPGLGLGFPVLHEMLTGPQRATPALTSIFSFIDALKTSRPPADAPLIDERVSAQQIDTIVDPWAGNETNAGHPASADVLPVYTPISVNGGVRNVCSTDAFSSPHSGSVNKLGSRRFLRVQVSAEAQHTVTAVATAMPAGSAASPGIVLHQRGRVAAMEQRPGEACVPGDPPSACSAVLAHPLGPGEHVIEVYEWTNAQNDPLHPPIGRTCFDVEITHGIAGKTLAPIALGYQLRGEPRAGAPLEIVLTAEPSADLEQFSMTVAGAGELTVSVAPAVPPAAVAAGEVVRRTVTVVPLADGRHHLRVLVTARRDGRAQARAIRVPVITGTVPARPGRPFVVDPAGQRIVPMSAE